MSTSPLRTRRGFFEVVGGYSAGAAVACLGVESSRGFLANDTIAIACMGTGGRCRHLMKSLVKVPGVRIVGVADIYDKHLAEGKKLADSEGRRDGTITTSCSTARTLTPS